jgi:hypothetical protein
LKFSFEKRVVSSKYHGRHTFCCFSQQKSANIFLLIFADFAEFQQTAKLLMKTLIFRDSIEITLQYFKSPKVHELLKISIKMFSYQPYMILIM